MALIKCPECGKDVSDTIESCIHCGFALTKKDKDKVPVKVSEAQNNSVKEKNISNPENSDNSKNNTPGCVIFLIAIVCVIGFFIFFAVIMNSCVSSTPQSNVTTTAPAVDIDLLKICNDYENNEIVAKETHLGKRYRIVAKVNRVTEEYVVVSPLFINGQTAVYLYYNYAQKDFVKDIAKDDIIIFEGTLTTFYSSIHMDFENVEFIIE